MTPEAINEFFSFLYEGRIGDVVFWLRIISGVLVSAFLAISIVSVYELAKWKKKIKVASSPPAPPAQPQSFAAAAWQEILKGIESANPSDWNLAVIRADSLFDSILKEKGLAGETLGERLKQLDLLTMSALNNVWEAHKIRNRIAHETDRILTHEEARRVISGFEGALKELGCL